MVSQRLAGIVAFSFPLLLIIDAGVAQKVYWGEDTSGATPSDPGQRIRRANLDGSNVEIVIPDEFTRGLAFDPIAQKLYRNRTSDGLFRSNLDGSDSEQVTPLGGWHVDIDYCKQKIYWARYIGPNSLAEITRSNLDGSGLEQLITYTSDAGIGSVAVDVDAGLVYFGRFSINRMNTDGTGFVQLIPIPTYVSAIRLDRAEGMLYWIEENRVLRAGTDGSNIELLIDQSLIHDDISLDLETRHIYWTNHQANTISRANLEIPVGQTAANRTDIEIVLDQLVDPHSILIQRNPVFADQNSNGIPDECEPDCNTNGVPDDLDIANATSADCNLNLTPDECDIAAGTSPDCDGDSVANDCVTCVSAFDCDDCKLSTLDGCHQGTCLHITTAGCSVNTVAGDLDGDRDFDLVDWQIMQLCVTGPNGEVPASCPFQPSAP